MEAHSDELLVDPYLDAEVRDILVQGLPIDLIGSAARELVERCEVALSRLDDSSQMWRIKLLTTQTVALSNIYSPAAKPVAQLIRDITLHSADDYFEAYALAAQSFTEVEPDTAKQRVVAGRTILDAATRYQDEFLAPAGYLILLLGLLETGEIHLLDLELSERGNLAETMPSLLTSAPARWFRCLRMILDGDLEHALAYVEQELEAVEEPEDSQTFALYVSQMGIIRWMSGQIHDSEDDFLRARRMFPDQIIWSASLCWLWLKQGRVAAAEALFCTLPPLDEIPHDRFWLPTMVTLAEMVPTLGGDEFARQIREVLLPYAKHLVTIANGVAFWGTVARSLGLLEERMGILAEAEHHLKDAIAVTRQIGAQAWLVEAQIEVAEFGLRHQRTDIKSEALLREAASTARARGFRGLLRRAEQKPSIRVLGRFEVLPYQGPPPEWTSLKAKELLKMLVSARGVSRPRESYMHLLWPDEDPANLINRFTVAVAVIRKALDPERHKPTQYFIQTQGDAIWLNTDRIDIDFEEFIREATSQHRYAQQNALSLYRGEAFSEEPYAEWAEGVRDTVEAVRLKLENKQPDLES